MDTQDRELQPDRVGLYVRPETRDRLNVYKAQRALATGRVYSQSDAIDELLEVAAMRTEADRA